MFQRQFLISAHLYLVWKTAKKKECQAEFFQKLNYGKKYDPKTDLLLPKLFRPTVRKNCSSDRGKLLKFEAEGREFANFLRSLERFIQTVKGQNNFW
jgi:hypothetical protein